MCLDMQWIKDGCVFKFSSFEKLIERDVSMFPIYDEPEEGF